MTSSTEQDLLASERDKSHFEKTSSDVVGVRPYSEFVGSGKEFEVDQVESKQFDAAAEEFLDVVANYKKLFDALGIEDPASLDQAKIEEILTTVASQNAKQILQESYLEADTELLKSSVMIHDLVWMIHFLAPYMVDPEKIEREATLLEFYEKDRKIKYVSQEVDAFLVKSRNIGIIPFETLDLLSQKSILIIGTSASARFIETIVSLGAKKITTVDEGETDRSNQPRLPGGRLSSVLHLGESKAITLIEDLCEANPFASEMQAIHGKVILDEKDRSSEADVNVVQLLASGKVDVVVEVVDSIKLKIELREYLRKNHPQIPLLALADIGNDPVVSIETGEDFSPFNQDFSESELAFLQAIGQTEGDIPAVVQLTAHKVFIERQLNTNYQLAAALLYLQVHGKFPQTTIGSEMAGAKLATLLLNQIQGDNIEKKPYRPTDPTPELIHHEDDSQPGQLLNKLSAAVLRQI